MLTKPIRSIKLIALGLATATLAIVPSASAAAETAQRTTPRDILEAGATSVQMRVQKGSRTTDVNVGHSDNKQHPVKNQSKFRAGSTTKLVVATAMMQLVERGKINLDAKIDTYLPGKLSFGKKVTVRQLLAQTSGLPASAYETQLPYNEQDIQTLKGMQRFLKQYYTDEQLREYINKAGLASKPGKKWDYSNANYVLAAQIIGEVTNRPYQQYVKKHIFKPLEMKHSSLPSWQTNMKKPYVHGYLGSEFYSGKPGGKAIDLSKQSGSMFGGSGSLVTTTGDINKFLQGLYGGKLLTHASLNEMNKVAVANPLGYGLGTMQISTQCGTVRGHNGNVYGYTTVGLYLKGKSVAISVAEGTAPYGELTGAANKLALEKLCPSVADVDTKSLREAAPTLTSPDLQATPGNPLSLR